MRTPVSAPLPPAFTTAGLPAHVRQGAWRNFLEARFAGLRVRDLGPVKRASARAVPLGLGTLVSMHTAQKTICHSPVPGSAATVNVVVVQRGAGRLSHLGRHAQLRAGQFALVDDRAPFELSAEHDSRHLLLQLPHAVVQARMPRIQRVLGQASSADSAANRYLVTTLCSLFKNAPHMGPDQRAVAEQSLLGLLSMGALPEVGGNASRTHWLQRAVAALDAHAHLTHVDAEALAAMLGVSRRFLDGIFADVGSTVSREIWERRLQHCATALRSPAYRGQGVLDVALAHGFAQAGHFSRSFRKRFGCTPTVWRVGGH